VRLLEVLCPRRFDSSTLTPAFKWLVTLSALLPILSNFVDYDRVPVVLVETTCGMAREPLVVDGTGSAPGEGIDSGESIHATHAASSTGSSSDTSATKYSKADTRPIISRVAQTILAKFVAPVTSGSRAVRLVRA
jgi:hypothetical protein